MVLYHRFWQGALGAALVDFVESLALDTRACAVVGVMPDDWRFIRMQRRCGR